MLVSLIHVLPVLWVACPVSGFLAKRSVETTTPTPTSTPVPTSSSIPTSTSTPESSTPRSSTPAASTSPPSHPSADGNEIHCYCNLPACITSSYMCKTEKTENGCFKRFDPTTRLHHYGCLDFSTRPQCSKGVQTDYHCCFSDMCNHESAEVASLNPPSNLSSADMWSRLGRAPAPQSEYEIWFRAMLIAVPIVGVIILSMLVCIALRLLRSDVPEVGSGTPKFIKDEYTITAATGVKLPQSFSAETYNYNLGNSFKSTKYTLLERRFPFVFRQQSQQHGNGGGGGGGGGAKCAKYQGFIPRDKYVADDATGVYDVPKVPEKFSRHHLNILKLPNKLNELKQKGDKNIYASPTINERDFNFSFANTVTNAHPYTNAPDLGKYDFNR